MGKKQLKRGSHIFDAMRKGKKLKLLFATNKELIRSQCKGIRRVDKEA
jgi:hypothetical protein